jgi:hypothetical protein
MLTIVTHFKTLTLWCQMLPIGNASYIVKMPNITSWEWPVMVSYAALNKFWYSSNHTGNLILVPMG